MGLITNYGPFGLRGREEKWSRVGQKLDEGGGVE